MKILSNRGFSLIQVLIAAGLLSIVSLGVAELMVSSSRVSNSMNTRMERVLFYSELSNTLTTEKNCTEAINNYPFNLTAAKSSTGMNFSLNLPGLGVVKSGKEVQNTNLTLDSLTMSNPSLQGTGPSGEDIYKVDLKALVKAKKDIVGGSLLKPAILPSIFITVDSGKIVSCSSEIGVSYLCKQMDGSYNPSTNKCKVLPTAKEACALVSGTYDSTSKKCTTVTASTAKKDCGSHKHGESFQTCTGSGCGGRNGSYIISDQSCIDGTIITTGSSRGRNSPSCFIAKTKVYMHDGNLKEISKVKIGDKVIGENGRINNVIGIEVPKLGTRYLFSINGGPFFVTAEHPFKTLSGWKSFDPIVTEQESPNIVEKTPMDIGDVLFVYGNEFEVLGNYQLKTDDPKMTVYNLLLDGNNTYYANGYLVHNKPH